MLLVLLRGNCFANTLGNMVARFAESDFPGEDVAVLVRPEEEAGSVLFLPRSASRVSPEAYSLLVSLQGLAVQAAGLEGQMAELTAEGRELGLSWNLLGFAQGLTGEALRKRDVDDEG